MEEQEPRRFEKMERQPPYADQNSNPYAATQIQNTLHRMQQNALMSNFPGRSGHFVSEREQKGFRSKADGQWQWDKIAPRAPSPMSSHLYDEGQGGNAPEHLYEGQTRDPKMELEKLTNWESGLQTHEQDMEIGYEDKPSTLTYEGLERRFLHEIMKLSKELYDAEEQENARHREKIVEINSKYQENLSSLRARQAKRREEFLLKESQARLHQHQQAELSPQLANTHPRAHGRVAVVQAHQAYPPGRFDSYRERRSFIGGAGNQGTEARVPIPEGRVYNNTSARHY